MAQKTEYVEITIDIFIAIEPVEEKRQSMLREFLFHFIETTRRNGRYGNLEISLISRQEARKNGGVVAIHTVIVQGDVEEIRLQLSAAGVPRLYISEKVREAFEQGIKEYRWL